MTCAVTECGRPRYCRGFCTLHYQRFRRTGDPLAVITRVPYSNPVPLIDRFWPKVDRSGGPDACWLWTGAKHGTGYGRVRGDDGLTKATHRVAFLLLVGPIPADRELDHLCNVRNCVNPDHLEPVTHGENLRRRYERARA